MFYPNGTSRVSDLIKYVNSDCYKIYFEDNRDKPEDWDFKKNGFYRGKRTEIKTIEDLMKAIEMDATVEGVTICIDTTDKYFEKNPHMGEEVTYVKEVFEWKYASPNGHKYCYAIHDSSYLGTQPKYKELCLECYAEEIGFGGSCFVIGSWNRDDEGYEFRSCGSRMFKYIEEEDLPIIWKAIKAADEYLNKRFETEDKD